MDKAAFHILFKKLYSPLCNYAFKIVNSHEEAEDIVQGIFVDFWNKPDKEQIEAAFENYLIRAVKFKCIDYQRKALVKRKYESEAVHGQAALVDTDEPEKPDLADVLQVAVAQLPEKTREVFILCKQEGKSYKEISEQLNISQKTVENQMGRAFRHLRESLKGHKELGILILFNIWIGV